MVELTTTTYLVMLAATVYAFWKFVIPRCWKFGVLFIRTVFMFIEAKRNDFSLWTTAKDLPRTLWKVWRADMDYKYEFSPVCCFNFRTADFESPLTKDQPWLDALAVLIRRKQKQFTLRFRAEDVGARKGKNDIITIHCGIRMVKFADAIVNVFVFEESNERIDGLIGHSLNQLIAVLEYYTPDVFGVMVKTPLSIIEYISTQEAETIVIDGEDHKLFMVVNSTIYQREMKNVLDS